MWISTYAVDRTGSLQTEWVLALHGSLFAPALRLLCACSFPQSNLQDSH